MNFIDPFSPSGYIASADFFQDGERYWNYAYARAASGGGTQDLHYTKISEGSLISNTGLSSGDVYSSINIEPLPNGNVFVVAHVDSGSGYTIETFEAAWSGETTPQTLGTADSVTQTDLHVEPDGTIHLCYFGGGEIKLRRRAPGQTTWETRTIPNPGGARVCSLDVNEAGDVVLAWASDFAARIAYLPKSGAITTGSYPIAVRFPSTIDAVFSFNSGSTQRFLPLIFYVDQNNLMAADTSHSSVVAVGMPDDAAVRVLPPTSVKEIEVIYRGNGDDRQQIGHLTYNLLESSASRNDFGPLYGGFANNQLYATRDQLGFPAALTTNTLDMAICRPMDGLDDDEDGLPLVVEHAIDSNLYADDTNPAIGWTALVNGRVELNSRIPLPVLGFFQSATVPQPECGEFRYKHMLSFDLMNHFTYAELINLGAPVTDIGTATGTSMIFGAPHLNQSFDFSSTARASLPTAFSRLEIERVTK